MVIFILGYGIFETRRLFEGPVINLVTPPNGMSVTTSQVTIEGSAQNISDISLNGRKIFIDSAGHFKEELLLSYGYNLLTFIAHDRFGRETKKILELVYTGPQ